MVDIKRKAAYAKAYYALHRDRIMAQVRAYKEAHPLMYRRGRGRPRIATDVPSLPAPLSPRAAQCEICGSLPTVRALALDHCHVTGMFRGWLCTRCNLGLGLLGDSTAHLRRALAYLERAERSTAWLR